MIYNYSQYQNVEKKQFFNQGHCKKLYFKLFQKLKLLGAGK